MFARHDPTIDRTPRLPFDPMMAHELRELLAGPSGMLAGATRFLLQGWSGHAGPVHTQTMLEIGTEALNQAEKIARAIGDLGRSDGHGPGCRPLGIVAAFTGHDPCMAGRVGGVSVRVPGMEVGSFGGFDTPPGNDPTDDIHGNLMMQREWRARLERALHRCGNDDLRRLLESVTARARVHEARWSAMLLELERAEDDTPCPGGLPREEDLIFDGRLTSIVEFASTRSIERSVIDDRRAPPRRPVLSLVPN